jgi:hypothetical protein
MYMPFNYSQINNVSGHYTPSQVKNRNNRAFDFWGRALFQRTLSVLNINVPEEWSGEIKDFFNYCIFRYGYITVFNSEKYGLSFQPCTLSGYNFYYQPTDCIISNPEYNKTLKIHNDCELLKLTPDYMGIWDVIDYYADKFSQLDTSINMSIINNRFAYVVGARNKAAAETLKKMFDQINSGQPAVFFDRNLMNDPRDKAEPWQFLERQNLKQSYITSDLLADFQTLLNNFDTEIGIPVIPYQKKERMVADEAKSKILDSTSRASVWLETLNNSAKLVNEMFGTDIKAEYRFNPELLLDNTEPEEGEIDGT